jgi:hypothetical protein
MIINKEIKICPDTRKKKSIYCHPHFGTNTGGGQSVVL